MPSPFLSRSMAYAAVARAYLSPSYRPKAPSLRLEVLGHALRLPEAHRGPFLLALVLAGFPIEDARRVSQFA